MLFLMLILVLTVLVALPVSALVEGDPAPDFTITDIDGNVFKLSNYRGTVVLLEFFSTLCPKCQAEVADLKQLYQIYGPDALLILSISREASATLRNFRDTYQIPWRIASDPQSVVFNEYDITTVVTLFIIDQEGIIYWIHVGYTNATTLKAKLDAVEVVAPPTFSPVPGTYSSSQSVTIACSTSDATIRYTLDGSEPTSSSVVYSGPIAVNSGTVTIKAKAFKSGMTDSATASATYTIQPAPEVDSESVPLLTAGVAVLAIAIATASILLWKRKNSAPVCC